MTTQLTSSSTKNFFFGKEIKHHKFLVSLLNSRITPLLNNPFFDTKARVILKLALHINSKTLSCYLSRDAIASALNVSVRTVTRATNALAEMGLIKTKRGGVTKTGDKLSNTYTLVLASIETWLISMMSKAKFKREKTKIQHESLEQSVAEITAEMSAKYEQKISENKVENALIAKANRKKTLIDYHQKLKAENEKFDAEHEERRKNAVSPERGLNWINHAKRVLKKKVGANLQGSGALTQRTDTESHNLLLKANCATVTSSIDEEEWW